jgi:hypothetical protein
MAGSRDPAVFVLGKKKLPNKYSLGALAHDARQVYEKKISFTKEPPSQNVAIP